MKRSARLLIAMLIAAAASVTEDALASASAEPCPDIAVAFARGTGELPGVGLSGVGQAFVDALRARRRVAGAVGVQRGELPRQQQLRRQPGVQSGTSSTARQGPGEPCAGGARGLPERQDAAGRLLAGRGGGGVLVTSDVVPADVPADCLPAPLPPGIDDRVAAVVLFGKPANGSSSRSGVPAAEIGPAFAGKSLELCALGDTVCSGDAVAWQDNAHGSYAMNGMAAEGAAFAISRLWRPTRSDARYRGGLFHSYAPRRA